MTWSNTLDYYSLVHDGVCPTTLLFNLRGLLGTKRLEVPDNVAYLDIETTGLEPMSDKIWQVAIKHCKSGSVTDYNGIISLTEKERNSAKFEVERRSKLLIEDGIPEDIAKMVVRESFFKQLDTGKPAAVVLRETHDILSRLHSEGCLFVGHNFIRFDIPFLEFAMTAQGLPFTFESNKSIDTGMLIKSARLRWCKLDTETAKQFYLRVADVRAKGLYYALERFCVPAMKLDIRYGVDVSKSHDALYDCWVTQLVFNEIVSVCRSRQEELLGGVAY